MPVASLSNVSQHPGHFPLVFAHMAAGTLMLFVGGANLYVGATRRHFRFHKLLGYIYLAGGSIGSALALVLALASPHRPGSQGFGVSMGATSDTGYALAALAAAWLLAAAMGYRAARNHRFDSHRAWMIRSYVLTWSFVLCRLIGRVPLPHEIGDLAAIVWLSWIVPLLACEVALQWSAGSARGKV
jgi:pimeloyl-ACP methyl ester carboxylesterase